MRAAVRLLSALLGLLIGSAGGLLAAETTWHWYRPQNAPLLLPWPTWRDRLNELTWATTEVRLAAAGVAFAGLLILLVALLARVRMIRMVNPATTVTVETTPRSLARAVSHHVRQQENVDTASVTATTRKVRIRVSSSFAPAAELQPQLVAAVTDLLDDLPLSRRPKLSVAVRSTRERQ
ncbi:DUF6286 domain-containing protein [Haloechinothrix halophila]|uniref:DUF6286 domain-containing protein n=1 Tax=Haloechinothrix halophila TaxID=1069073 RepID=UPI00041C8A46|nr:DUF6286 domain-containing protein [Haloechinothrix halophila]